MRSRINRTNRVVRTILELNDVCEFGSFGPRLYAALEELFRILHTLVSPPTQESHHMRVCRIGSENRIRVFEFRLSQA